MANIHPIKKKSCSKNIETISKFLSNIDGANKIDLFQFNPHFPERAHFFPTKIPLWERNQHRSGGWPSCSAVLRPEVLYLCCCEKRLITDHLRGCWEMMLFARVKVISALFVGDGFFLCYCLLLNGFMNPISIHWLEWVREGADKGGYWE